MQWRRALGEEHIAEAFKFSQTWFHCFPCETTSPFIPYHKHIGISHLYQICGLRKISQFNHICKIKFPVTYTLVAIHEKV
jgi:hypothetical protein